MKLLEAIEAGRRGDIKNITLIEDPTNPSSNKLQHQVWLGKHRYILLGGVAGSFKTTVTDAIFVLNLIIWYLRWGHKEGGLKPYVIYRSMERSWLEKEAKWLAYLIYWFEGVVYDVATILGGPNKIRELTDEDMQLFRKYENLLDKIMQHIDIVIGPTSSDQILLYGKSVAMQKGWLWEAEDKTILCNGKKVGEFRQDVYTEEKGIKKLYWDGSHGRIFQNTNLYIPRDKDELIQHLSDHIHRIRDSDKTDRKTLDAHGENMAFFKDVCGWQIVDVAQFNRSIEDLGRKLQVSLEINRKDFRGSDTPFHHADLVLGTLNPLQFSMKMYERYPLDKMREGGASRFFSFQVIKNSFGPSPIKFAIAVLGENGAIKFLPKVEDMTDQHYEFIKKRNLKLL